MHEKRLESPVTLPDMSTWSDKNLPSQWTQQTGVPDGGHQDHHILSKTLGKDHTNTAKKLIVGLCETKNALQSATNCNSLRSAQTSDIWC